VKRFSAKEERRRIVASIYDPALTTADSVGFENHVNYFHSNGRGLSEHLARGLSIFLNSTVVDAYFRLFSGHTQVNATDLRSLRYPTKEVLEGLGAMVMSAEMTQGEIDEIVDREAFHAEA
jgi:adenine-specific DNA-methyltransferase